MLITNCWGCKSRINQYFYKPALNTFLFSFFLLNQSIYIIFLLKNSSTWWIIVLETPFELPKDADQMNQSKSWFANIIRLTFENFFFFLNEIKLIWICVSKLYGFNLNSTLISWDRHVAPKWDKRMNIFNYKIVWMTSLYVHVLYSFFAHIYNILT
jgi:hypothetical protein